MSSLWLIGGGSKMNGFTLRSSVTTVLVAAALALTGCAGGGSSQPSASSSPSDAAVTPTPTGTAPAATPSATEPSADPADITTWTVSEQGIGPVLIGDAFADTATGLPTWKVSEACSWTAFLPADDGSVNGYFVREADEGDGTITTVAFEALADSVVPSDGPRSAQGIGLGSTREEVMAAYPDAVAQTPTIGDGEYLRVGAQGSAAVYFQIREGAAAVTALTVTDRDEPPYEVCG
jgi:hypothetical protein